MHGFPTVGAGKPANGSLLVLSPINSGKNFRSTRPDMHRPRDLHRLEFLHNTVVIDTQTTTAIARRVEGDSRKFLPAHNWERGDGD